MSDENGEIMTKIRIATVVGSFREQSINLKLAKALQGLCPFPAEFTFVKIQDLPFFDQAFENDPPAAIKRFKKEIKDADAVLMVTPEYNRSIPGVLKNAIDCGSRPPKENCWEGLPVAVIGASPGAIGTAVAQSHLKIVLAAVGMQTMVRPEAYLSVKPDLFDDKGNISIDGTKEFLIKYLNSFQKHIETFAQKR